MWPPEPHGDEQGGKIIAQGKAAEAAALGKRHPTPLSFYQSEPPLPGSGGSDW